LAIAAVTAGLAACKHGDDPRPASSGAAGDQPKRHAVQGQELKTLMARVAQLNSTLPKDLPGDVETTAGPTLPVAAAATATSADRLAAAALSIPRSVDAKPLGEADRAAFNALAQTLHDQAVRLRGDAEKIHVEAMQRDADAITATCAACHGRFRDLAGPLDTTRSLRPATAPQR
jgi:cytochrome c556